MSTTHKTPSEFVMPEKEIKELQWQLHSIPEIGNNFAYVTSFVTYKLSYSTTYGSNSFKEFSSRYSNSSLDLIIRSSSRSEAYHSIRRGSSGVTWIVPKSSIDAMSPKAAAASVKVFVNFNEEDSDSLWYILDFYYDIISIDENLKQKHADKLRSLSNKIN